MSQMWLYLVYNASVNISMPARIGRRNSVLKEGIGMYDYYIDKYIPAREEKEYRKLRKIFESLFVLRLIVRIQNIKMVINNKRASVFEH